MYGTDCDQRDRTTNLSREWIIRVLLSERQAIGLKVCRVQQDYYLDAEQAPGLNETLLQPVKGAFEQRHP